MNKEEYAKYQKLVVKGEVLAPTKMVHFMNEDGTKQFTAAISGDARVLYKLYEWSRNGIKANSVEDLGDLLNKALHETVVCSNYFTGFFFFFFSFNNIRASSRGFAAIRCSTQLV